MHRTESISVIWVDEVDDRLLCNFIERLGANHFQTGAVHVQQEATAGHHLYTCRLGIDDRLQPAFTTSDDLCGALTVCDVLGRPDEPYDFVGPVEHDPALHMKRPHL